ncbi:MAG: efflux RND transporter periplasmic adaptor subunit [Planctomycetota bacterium]
MPTKIQLSGITSLALHRLPEWLVYFAFAVGILFVWSCESQGQIDGFTTPFKSIELSSDESGAIAEMNVEEGDSIREGEVIAKLDSRVQQIQLQIAQQMAENKSQVMANQQMLSKREAISARLKELRDKGHASESEIIRSEMELSIANAKYLASLEEQEIRKIEQKRAAIQLERRNIVSPMNGVVSKLHRKNGEFLSPLHPEVVTIIQIDRLLATFPVPSQDVKNFQVGQEFNLKLENENSIAAKIYGIGVETDAQSGTVEVKFVIDNEDLKLRSGEICTFTY